VLCVCVILSFFSTKDTQTQKEEEEEDEQLLSTLFSSRKSLSTVVI
jgi:hypothetical protein